ncbi:MAG: hypothetical protein N2652_11645 [Kiritimatiellae bacterium]|nr:hypothetical protein [Kiritimatiellia bacterium]
MTTRAPQSLRIRLELFVLPPCWDGNLRARRLLVPLDGPPDLVARRALGRRRPLWVHSTSWRCTPTGIVLTYLALLARAPADIGTAIEISTADLHSQGQQDPRNPCTARCRPADVLRHGLRHLASLCRRPKETPCLARLPMALRERLAKLDQPVHPPR